MPQFSFVARDSSGAVARGIVAAASPTDAARLLRSEGKYPVRVEPARSRDVATSDVARAPKLRGGKLRSDDVIYFSSQLMVMLETGVSLAEALAGCRSPKNSPRFAAALDDVIEQVESGNRFSVALAAHPRVFPPLLVSLVRASEASGQLALMLQRASDYLIDQRELNKRIRGAVTYPIAMLVFAAGVTIFLMSFMLPKFAGIYAGRERALPTATRILLSGSDMLRDGAIFIGPAVLAAVAGGVVHFRRPAGRRHWDWLKLHLPIFGPMFHRSCMARSLRTLGTMISGGVSVLDAVELTRSAANSATYERLWQRVGEELQHGRQISDVLAESPLVPSPITQMVRAGERSGKLGPVLERIAAHAATELAITIKAATALIEPVIITVLGAVVGGLVIALLLPIFTLSRTMH